MIMQRMITSKTQIGLVLIWCAGMKQDVLALKKHVNSKISVFIAYLQCATAVDIAFIVMV